MSRLRDLPLPRLLLAALIAALVVALVVAASTSTAAFGAYNDRWDGAAGLRSTADDLRTDAEIVRNVSAYERAPDRSVALVLSPARAYSRAEAATLRRFVRRGGTLVVAEDFGTHSNPLLAQVGAGARIDGGLLRDERFNHRSPAMPVATNVSRYPLMSGVGRLTLNHGTVVEPNGATVAASSSAFGYLDRNRNAEIDGGESLASHPVVTVERVGAGRVIVVSDPSLFINAMLDRQGNRQFVYNLFGAHERVLLDYSHAEQLPPLTVALLAVRGSVALQLGLLFAGLAAVVLWGRGVFGRLRSRIGRSRPEPAAVSPEALTAYLERTHPEWDEAAVRRVTKGVLSARREGEDND